MFGLRRKKEVEEEVEQAPPQYPTAAPALRLVPKEKQRSYSEVAAQLGFSPAELLRAQLLEFFTEEGIELFSYGQVRRWLTSKAEKAEAKGWCWRPLREKDAITSYRWGYNRESKTWNDGHYSSERWECRPYARLIPQRALERVAKIEGRFGDRVRFFVSHYYVPNVDPFIAVRPAVCDDSEVGYMLIFDAWDEPGFGE